MYSSSCGCWNLQISGEMINQDIHQHDKIFSEKENRDEIEKVKEEIDKILAYKTQGAMVRTRQNWIKYGEKNCKFFLTLERYNFMSKNRFKLRDEKGRITTNPKEILKIQERFHRQLYKKDEGVKMSDTYLANVVSQKLSEDDCKMCDNEITLLELKSAVAQLRRDKTPGIDGFPIEWYDTFYEKLKPILLPLFREISRYGLPNTSKRGVISLLEKAGKDQLQVTSWRPLSLLNCDGITP